DPLQPEPRGGGPPWPPRPLGGADGPGAEWLGLVRLSSLDTLRRGGIGFWILSLLLGGPAEYPRDACRPAGNPRLRLRPGLPERLRPWVGRSGRRGMANVPWRLEPSVPPPRRLSCPVRKRSARPQEN